MLELSEIQVLKSDRLTRWANAMSGFYGHPIYLVGSCLNKPNPRDVDLVVVMPDEEFKLRYINHFKSIGKDTAEKVNQWGMRYKTGLYDKANWLWWDDMYHKSLQGMEQTSLLIDFKVFPKQYDIETYSDKEKLRIDTRQMPYEGFS